MFGDFLNLSYEKTKNKIATIRDLLNRIGKTTLVNPDVAYGNIISEIDRIDDALDDIEPLIDYLGGTINDARKPPNEPFAEDTSDSEAGGDPEEPIPVPAGVIVHVHNPEGREIGSIFGNNDAPHTIGLNYGVVCTDASTHGIATSIPLGSQTVVCTFNNMTLQKTLFVEEGQLYTIYFTFARVDQPMIFDESASTNTSESWDWPPGIDVGYEDSSGLFVSASHYEAIGEGSGAIESSNHLSNEEFSYNLNVTVYSNQFSYDLKAWMRGNWSGNPDVPFAVPIQTEFRWWWAQSLITNHYPICYLYKAPGGGGALAQQIIPSEPYVDPSSSWRAKEGSNIETVSALQAWEKLRFIYEAISGESTTIIRVEGNGTSGDSEILTNSGEAILKFASVPWDIDGTAV